MPCFKGFLSSGAIALMGAGIPFLCLWELIELAVCVRVVALLLLFGRLRTRFCFL